MTVTSLDTAADLAADEARAALPDLVVDQVRFTAAALAGILHGGDGDDPEVVRSLTFGRSYAELHAPGLLLADCADTVKVARACGINPGLAAGNAKRMAVASVMAGASRDNLKRALLWLAIAGTLCNVALVLDHV